ncbi:MAG: hypothetical protein OEU26_29670, partial [Candidatus Tectomicrobia bacterium]|nr:hypothetical protein [Candidatus Tectomicrobia bacterium]
ALGADAELIRQFLYPEHSAALVVDSSASRQSDQEKFRLFRAVSRVTLALAQQKPLLIVMDDSHWADPPSVDLFSHLVFTVADAVARETLPLLIIAAYRPVEPEARLARLIARLQREEICYTLDLAGLDEAEVYEFIQSLGIERPSHQLIATVREVTQGNPLFIQEVMHHLAQQRALQECGGYVVTTSSAAGLRLSDHVTGTISSRFDDLSEPCRKLLTLAAFLGERFHYDVLAAVSGVQEDELLVALEEGLRHRLLLSSGQLFHFAHPLVQHVFYHEPSAARRQRLHARIAQILESFYAGHLDDHILEIAHHLIRADGMAEAHQTTDYMRRAGDQAFALFAWGEAAHYYEAVLGTVQETDRLSLQERAELHYWAGLAYYRDHDVGPCLDHYEKAIEMYRSSEDVKGLAHMLMVQTRALYTLTPVPLGTLIEMQPLEDVLEALGESEPGLRGSIAAVMAEAYCIARQTDKAEEMATQAIATGRRIADDRLSAYASSVLAQTRTACMHFEEALQSWQDALAFARQCGDEVTESLALQRTSLLLILQGRLHEAEAMALEGCEFTRKTHDWGGHSVALSALATIALARGQFEAVEQYAHDAMVMVERSRYPWGGSRALHALAAARALRGAWAEAERALDRLVELGRVFTESGAAPPAFVGAFRQLLRVQAGDVDAPMQWCAAERVQVGLVDFQTLAPFCMWVEMANLCAAPDIAAHPCRELTRVVAQGVRFSAGWVYLLPRVLGVGAALQHREEEAEAHFQSALALAAQVGAEPELGRTYLDYARLLSTRDDADARDCAIAFVTQAQSVFDKLGMTPCAQQAAQLAERLRTRTDTGLQGYDCDPDPFGEAAVLLNIAGTHTHFLG